VYTKKRLEYESEFLDCFASLQDDKQMADQVRHDAERYSGWSLF